MMRDDRALVTAFSLIVIFLALCILLAGCGQTFDHGWTLVGAPVPDAFEHETIVAAEVIRVQEGVLHREWGGTVSIEPAPFLCPDGAGLCGGWSADPHAIRVAYDEALGLGPAVGSTALEWELCNAARQMRSGGSAGNDGPGTAACVERAMPEIERRLVP